MQSEWPEVALGDLITIKHGFAFRGEYFTDTESPFVLITPGNFAIGGGFQEGKPKFYSGPVPQEYVLRPGDLVVTMTDLSRACDTLGFSAVVPEGLPRTYLHNQRVGLVQIRANAPVVTEWLALRQLVAKGVLVEGVNCRRRSKSEPPRRPNIEPGVEADFDRVGCG
jgi:type I restriction enzyme S subunit